MRLARQTGQSKSLWDYVSPDFATTREKILQRIYTLGAGHDANTIPLDTQIWRQVLLSKPEQAFTWLVEAYPLHLGYGRTVPLQEDFLVPGAATRSIIVIGALSDP